MLCSSRSILHFAPKSGVSLITHYALFSGIFTDNVNRKIGKLA